MVKRLGVQPLLPGESALQNAPVAELKDGLHCIPQHYLNYQHSRESVEHLILMVEYHERYPIFVAEDDGGVYLQVGIVGWDNYKDRGEQSNSKIVYGRKWRVEPQLPTSEILQTAFLALKKAREHEVRELFRLKTQNKWATPFNNHHDFPLLSQSKEQLTAQSVISIEQVIPLIEYDHARFVMLGNEKRRNGTWIVDLEIIPSNETELPELRNNQTLSLILNNQDANEFLHKLMHELLVESDRHVDENFKFDGFTRFSWHQQVLGVAELSIQTRQLHKQAHQFNENWVQNNYETDLTRVPKISKGRFAEELRARLEPFEPFSGITPF